MPRISVFLKYATMARLLLFLLACLSFVALTAQTNLEVDPNDLYAAGDTRSTGNNCFRLTTAQYWEAGSVWYEPRISLREPFEMEMNIMLGCKDEMGADGLVFIFHPNKVPGGYKGEGMGFAGLVPSLGVEIDTYQNYHLGDPEEDHIGIMLHGNVQHLDPGYNLVGPIKVGNLEDCNTHLFRINWEPDQHLLSVVLDGKMIVSHQVDLVKDVFGGKDQLYWGVAAATGKKTNIQEICFKQLTFNVPQLGYSIKRDLLEGEIVDLKPIVFPKGGTALSQPARQELDKIFLLLEENPKHTLQIYFNSNEGYSPENEKRISTQRSEIILDYLKGKGIDTDRLKLQAMGSQFSKRNVNGIEVPRKGNWVSAYFFIPRA